MSDDSRFWLKAMVFVLLVLVGFLGLWAMNHSAGDGDLPRTIANAVYSLLVFRWAGGIFKE